MRPGLWLSCYYLFFSQAEFDDVPPQLSYREIFFLFDIKFTDKYISLYISVKFIHIKYLRKFLV